MKKLILASTSTVFGQKYLEYLKPTLKDFFSGVDRLIFIPFARPGGMTHDDYTEHVARFFQTMDIEVEGLHACNDPITSLTKAEAIFTGGGNTFVLVNALHKLKLMPALREAIFNGSPYLGSSAGSNIGGVTMQTTNDMPIVYPPSFKTLGAIPFNINPHYLDPQPGSEHMGETREIRINEFHTQSTIPVIGLREGSWLEVSGDEIILKGKRKARLFCAGKAPKEKEPGFNFNTL